MKIRESKKYHGLPLSIAIAPSSLFARPSVVVILIIISSHSFLSGFKCVCVCVYERIIYILFVREK